MAVTPTYGITFQELDSSPTIDINTQDMTASRRFLVAWADWQNFAQEVIGTYRVVGTVVQYVTPLPFPGQANLLPDSISIRPQMPDAPLGTTSVTLGSVHNEYTNAIVTVGYKTQWFNPPSGSPLGSSVTLPNGTWVTLEGSLGGEMLTIPGRMFQWTGTAVNLPDDVNPGIFVPSGNFTLTWHRVLLPPWSTMRSLRGKVNSASFLGAAAETILYTGATYSREFLINDDGGTWKISYSFAESSKQLVGGGVGGWNHFWKDVNGKKIKIE